MNVRIIFLDIDGTLFSHRTNRVPESAQKALDAVKGKIPVFACTGRHVLELKDMDLGRTEFDGMVTVNGAYNYDRNGLISSAPIPKGDIAKILAYDDEHPIPIIFLEADRMYINRYDRGVEEAQARIHTPLPEILPKRRALENPVYQLIPYCTEEVWKPLYDTLEHCIYTRWDIAMDVTADTCGKAAGIRSVLEHYGIRKEDAMSFGDGPNDLDMFKACGTNVAMGNSVPVLKEAADYVTEDIDEDGLYSAFVHYGLIEDQI